MLFDEAEYEVYIGNQPPLPLQRWYDEAVVQLKQVFICFTEDLPPEQLEILKYALMLQIDHADDSENVTDFAIGKFRASVKKSKKEGLYSTTAIDKLRPIFDCGLWVYPNGCSPCL